MGAKRFKNYEDLHGANIGSSGITSGTAFVLRRMMAAKGLQYPKDYNLIHVGPSVQSYLALTASRVDAALIAVPLSSDAAKIGYNIVGRASDIIPNYQLTEISTRRSWAEKNRPVMVRFMKAMCGRCAGSTTIKKPRSSSSPKRCGSKPSTCAKAGSFTPSKKFGILTRRANVEGVRTVIQIMGERGLLKAPLPTPAKYLDHSYAEEALKELGKR
jgi:hypothetical protein